MAKFRGKISSGIYKGKSLELPSLGTTRSTKSIVKGSFFDSFRYELEGSCFIEGFGGSGGMALEALSNGAKEVFAIEKDRKAYEITRRNFALFGVEKNALNGDCFALLPQILANLDNEKIFIYLDPPFDIRDGFAGIYERVVGLICEICECERVKFVIIEHASEVKFEANIAKFSLLKSKKFGATTLSCYAK
ncbi:16S rRNA (guanine(966)-N(2))-methyltransferase RsmD [Campylobacter sp. JMF_01 NE2]|uniref:16S rRNA (guanine(966)-N(2))-methyltransferase RsmD n=1 Tax=unclassified Campylobacter TaxID=2593542 RepID=UPI0022E9D8D8|nr:MULTISPECIES: 16S rRNA (guanine(966)-N(2))-methyltransferase RsmD [unclassified Campylobacter]MDA3046314.1 16S rRNA (guanine(966)-N(2))-methyltransferase RsmD [Campylobacter sp. VBCF_06 NA8]MDA3052748.1 16S rRNA (guanine(966)-N(2))-methyltransferase RsmD [Campylobacter sp. JMF_03 NE3]MDA3067079.1 16S rRNA (guanine(966)-N(2))-methyltransferase RsmD [Campylobacter sp. JMF_01 NE2]